MNALLNQKKIIFILLFIFTLLGGFLRFYKITSNPVSLNIDEVAIGYNAYSILKTAKDEYGYFLPLSFRSVEDYKSPVLVYLEVPSIAIFGLNEFGVRFPVAFISTLSIILFYFFFKELTENKALSLVGSFLTAISPWHIYYSRYGVESQIATSLAVLGFWALLKLVKSQKLGWSVLAAFSLSLSMYSYHTEKLFIPLMILVFLLAKRRELIEIKEKTIVFVILMGLLVIPLGISILFGHDSTRAQVTFINKDIELRRNVLTKTYWDKVPLFLSPLVSFFSQDGFLILFYWVRKYLNYFQPSFLFYSGLNLTASGIYGLGVLYLFELPALIFGIFQLLADKLKNKGLIMSWILLGIFPASLTQNEQHSLRSLITMPMLTLVVAAGMCYLLRFLNDVKNNFLKSFAILSVLLFVFWNLIFAWLMYWVHFPKQRSEDFMDGTKSAVEYILQNQDKYKEVVFDPYRGLTGPYIVSIPHMYILFYSQYDPKKYQQEAKSGNEEFRFGKYVIRRVDWREDRAKSDTLFVSNPWNLPEKDVEPKDLKQKIYLVGGKLAFLVVGRVN